MKHFLLVLILLIPFIWVFSQSLPLYHDKRVNYSEWLFTGNGHFDRSVTEPLHPSGFRLPHVSFTYKNLQVKMLQTGPEVPFKILVSLEVTNTGKKEGSEVVEVYLHKIQYTRDSQVKVLKTFAEVILRPGETKQVSLLLDRDDFLICQPGLKTSLIDPGEYEFLVGPSSRDIRLKASRKIR